MKKVYYILMLLVVGLVVSCGKEKTETAAEKPKSKLKRIVINENEEPQSINPNLTTDSTGITVNSIMSEGLMRSGRDGSPVAGLAEKWETSEDGLTWTFHLREGLKWSNGDPLTANDFKFSWLKVLDRETGAKKADLLYVIKGAEAYNTGNGKKEDVGINVIDDKTLEVKLEQPTEYFLSLLAHVTYSPISEKFYEKTGTKYGLEPENTVASGPYVLKSWSHSANLVLAKNENYWNKDAIKLDEIEIKLITDNEAALNAFNNKEIDLIRISSAQYEKYKDDKRIHMFQNNSVWFLLFNVKNELLKNEKIRTAIQMGISRDELANKVLGGIAKPATGLIPDGINGLEKSFREESGTLVPDYNLEEAKKLYQEGLKELGLEKAPKLTLLINDALNNKKVAEFAQEQLRINLGLEVEIIAVPYKERLEKSQQHDFDMVFTSTDAEYADPKTYLEVFMTNVGNNYGLYSNPKYDELVKKSSRSNDKKERAELMREAEKTLVTDFPAAFLYFQTRIVILNSSVKNLYFKGVGAEYYLYEAEIQD